jgi:predicted RNA binding protein YcfA (HicA-like mRNA interferase family)
MQNIKAWIKSHIWINPKTEIRMSIPSHQSKELPTGTANRIKEALRLKNTLKAEK